MRKGGRNSDALIAEKSLPALRRESLVCIQPRSSQGISRVASEKRRAINDSISALARALLLADKAGCVPIFGAISGVLSLPILCSRTIVITGFSEPFIVYIRGKNKLS